jgi:glycosyltransferase involved in cell wall biosynthesis
MPNSQCRTVRQILITSISHVQIREPAMTALTVIIPCRDEQRNIAACIESVQGLAAEIIVADNGSTDGTRAIARQMSCRIIEREFVGYANFKNWAIPQAQHEWVLILDADERMTPQLADEIRQLLAGSPDCDAYRMRRSDVVFGNPVRCSGSAGHYITRLLRRDVCRYQERRVHEEIDARGLRVGRLLGRLDHFTAADFSTWAAKQLRYGILEGEERFALGKKHGFCHLLGHAPLRFLQLYLLRGGFRDGYAGLVICTMAAFYTFVKDARLWELNQQVRPQPRDRVEPARSPAAMAAP